MPLTPPGAPREAKAAPAAEPDQGPGPPEARPDQAAGRSARAGPSAPRPPRATWTAVVTTDRAYYDSVYAVNEQDTASISFPGELPERRIPLTGAEVRIGRRSVSRGIEPEIDLIGPPLDPGVSRLHAKLVPAPDGSWTVVDLGTENGITVNGQDVPSGDSVPLRPGDRIHLGAWTKITITRG